VKKGWAGALRYCDMDEGHIMQPLKARVTQPRSSESSIIDAAATQPEFSITVPGCLALLLRFVVSEKIHGENADVPAIMRRSASVLHQLVDKVCSRKRLVVQLPNLHFPLTLVDGMVDLGSFSKAQVDARVHKRRRTCGLSIGSTHVCEVGACGAQPVRSRALILAF